MQRLVILGAAGRDFHNFNVVFREDPGVEVVAFTATQIPDIAGRRYPPELAGERYPDGIPIVPEDELESLIDQGVDRVVFSYSDVSHEYVMHLAARSVAAGASFEMLGDAALLESVRPVIAVTAPRTGAGKSQTSRKLRRILADSGMKVAAVRHPMPYGDLVAQRLQRFGSYADLDAADVTIEEREEYEPYIRDGAVIFAGVDYEAILRAAEAEADVIVWDGGNNDLPFYRPTVHICVLDPHRAGHEVTYWPGEVNFRRADVLVINKMGTAPPDGIETVRRNIELHNPDALVIEADSTVTVEDPASVTGRRVLVIEDGLTLTHGEMAYGAGTVAARDLGAAELIDPRPFAVGSIAEVYKKYTHIGPVLPAMGYGDAQQAELKETIEASGADTVVIGTPID
ncbi:MAG: GTPase, partial [Acidimicrobiia bacterium]|nr:GTPase [Acidimicrobiia bacterium]